MSSEDINDINGAADARPSFPSDYDGMRVDVYADESQMLFEARLKIINDSLVMLERVSEPMAAVTDDISVNIRGLHPAQNIGVYMSGRLKRLAPAQDRDWIVRDFHITGEDRGRVFSRTPLQVGARIADDPAGTWRECSAINVSAGGVRIRTESPLETGARIYIRFRLRREAPPLLCAVRQGLERDGLYEYGCEFVEITPEVESAIARTMIELQIMNH